MAEGNAAPEHEMRGSALGVFESSQPSHSYKRLSVLKVAFLYYKKVLYIHKYLIIYLIKLSYNINALYRKIASNFSYVNNGHGMKRILKCQVCFGTSMALNAYYIWE